MLPTAVSSQILAHRACEFEWNGALKAHFAL